MLERGLDRFERFGVDQLAELLLAEQLAQEIAVERQGRRAALGVRRVALVHVRRDVVEEKRGRKWRCGSRLDLDQGDAPGAEVGKQGLQARQVEDVAKALAVGLQDHREPREVLGDLEEVLRLQALLPEGRALAGVGARKQERPRRVLAKASAEESGAAELGDDKVFDLVRFEEHQVAVGRLVGVGQVDDDPVVGPDRVRLEVELVADLGREGQTPSRVDAAAERGQDAEAPVADLVAELLDNDRLVGGNHPRGRLLLLEVGQEVLGRELVQVVVLRELLRVHRDRLAGELADRTAELGGAADAVAAPERDSARHARCRRDDHAVAGDVLDPPGGGAKQECLALARLVDHLLVELADPAAVGKVHAVEPAVGNGPGVGHRQLASALSPTDRPGGALPDDPRPELGEALGRVAAVEHVQHVLQLLAAEVENGSVAVTTSKISSTVHSSSATIETMCWASTSSGLRGITVSSISPSRIRRATTAHSRRSARNFGKMRPFETSPRLWPARPTRWRPRVTDFGDSTWITRSTAPMSIPSSSDEVATRHGS